MQTKIDANELAKEISEFIRAKYPETTFTDQYKIVEAVNIVSLGVLSATNFSLTGVR